MCVLACPLFLSCIVVFSFSVNDKVLLTSKRENLCVSLLFDIISKFVNFKSAIILCFGVFYLLKFQPNLICFRLKKPEIEAQITKE